MSFRRSLYIAWASPTRSAVPATASVGTASWRDSAARRAGKAANSAARFLTYTTVKTTAQLPKFGAGLGSSRSSLLDSPSPGPNTTWGRTATVRSSGELASSTSRSASALVRP
eukprot:scaffold39874_cov30-Tisochrysis_lutea.AAC.1